jgi:hypothetical protein
MVKSEFSCLLWQLLFMRESGVAATLNETPLCLHTLNPTQPTPHTINNYKIKHPEIKQPSPRGGGK